MSIGNVISIQKLIGAEASIYNHPDYDEYMARWEKWRDVYTGTEAIKAKTTQYLPSFEHRVSAQHNAYTDYLERAIFVPYGQKIVNGLVSLIFRKPVRVKHAAAKKYDPNNLSKRHINLQAFAREIAREVLVTGRVGVLVDWNNEINKAFAYIFPAEDIISWAIDTEGKLNYILLRETTVTVPTPFENNGKPSTSVDTTYLAYRINENGLCEATRFDSKFDEIDTYRIIVKGRQIDYIPFTFFSSEGNYPEITPSVLADIFELNIKHYQNYALLQLGRKHTAFPIYFVPLDQSVEENSEFVLNPSVVWEVPIQSKPGVLEYYGRGLDHLANSLRQLESEIVQIMGRITGLRSTDTKYEAPNIFQLLYSVEVSILTSIMETLASGLKQVVEQWLAFSGAPEPRTGYQVEVKLKSDFNTSNIEARELRAIAALHNEGLLPLEQTFEVLQNSGYIPREVMFDEYRELVDKAQEEIMAREQLLAEIKALSKGKIIQQLQDQEPNNSGKN